jgi:hypothetical protein
MFPLVSISSVLFSIVLFFCFFACVWKRAVRDHAKKKEKKAAYENKISYTHEDGHVGRSSKAESFKHMKIKYLTHT